MSHVCIHPVTVKQPGRPQTLIPAISFIPIIHDIINEWRDVMEICWGEQIWKRKLILLTGFMINEDNDVSQEIKARVASGDRYDYSPKTVIRSKIVSQRSKIQIYRSIFKPIITYDGETWVLKKAKVGTLTGGRRFIWFLKET